jgi:uncharacterized protein DUF4337
MEEPEVPTEHLHEEIHHQAEHSGLGWVLGVALSSALLAGFAAVASLKAGEYANEAMVTQIRSSDQWAHYQSKGIKEAQLLTKTELLEALGKTVSQEDTNKIAEYSKDKEEIQKKAEELQTEAKEDLRIHEILARAVTLFQIAIAVGAISVLIKRRSFWFVSLAFGLVGLIFAAQAFKAIF